MADATCSEHRLEGTIRGTNFTIEGIDDAAAGLVQSFQLQFTRNLARVYDLADPGFYYIEGPSKGEVGFTKIVGPKGAPKLTCDCEPRTLVLNAGETICFPEPTAAQIEGATYTLLNALPFGISGQGNSNNFLISFSISYLFSDLR